MHSSPISRNRGATIQTRRRNSVQSVRRSISIDLSVIKANFNGAESRVEIVGRSRDIDSDESAKHQSLFGSEPNSIRLINSSTTDRHRCETGEKTEAGSVPIRNLPVHYLLLYPFPNLDVGVYGGSGTLPRQFRPSAEVRVVVVRLVVLYHVVQIRFAVALVTKLPIMVLVSVRFRFLLARPPLHPCPLHLRLLLLAVQI